MSDPQHHQSPPALDSNGVAKLHYLQQADTSSQIASSTSLLIGASATDLLLDEQHQLALQVGANERHAVEVLVSGGQPDNATSSSTTTWPFNVSLHRFLQQYYKSPLQPQTLSIR